MRPVEDRMSASVSRLRTSPLVSSSQVSPTRCPGSTRQSMVHRKHLWHSVHADDGLRARGSHPVTSGSPRASRTEAVRTVQTRVVWVSVTQRDPSPSATCSNPSLPTAVTCGRCLLGVCLSRRRMRKQSQRFMLLYIALYIRLGAG